MHFALLDGLLHIFSGIDDVDIAFIPQDFLLFIVQGHFQVDGGGDCSHSIGIEGLSFHVETEAHAMHVVDADIGVVGEIFAQLGDVHVH